MPLKRVPESIQSQLLSVTLGRSAGPLITTATNTVQQCQEKLTQMCYAASEEIAEKGINLYNINSTVTATRANGTLNRLQAFRELPQIQMKLRGVRGTLNTIKRLPDPLRLVIRTTKLPISALEALINIIKILPILQRWLPVSFTTTYTDLMINTMATVAQIKDIVAGLESTLESFQTIVDPVLESIDRVQGSINLAETSEAFREIPLTEEDFNILRKEGIINGQTGRSVFDDLAKEGSISGQGIALYIGTGSLQGISEEELRNRSYTALQRTGSLYRVEDIEGNIKLYNSGDQDFSVEKNLDKKVEKIPVISAQSTYSEEQGLYWVETPDDMLRVLVSKLQNTGVTKGVKDKLSEFIKQTDIKTIDTDKNIEFLYKGSDGQDYTFRLVRKEDTGTRAVQHYVVVVDQTGVEVLKGTPSFSSNTDILVREMIFALDQLLR